MSEKKAFLLRMDPEIHEALQRWAADELRSLNGQIEFLLRRSLQDSGREGASGKGAREGRDTKPRTT